MRPQCKNKNPLSDLRCILHEGHKGKHRANPKELEAFVRKFIRTLSVEMRRRKS